MNIVKDLIRFLFCTPMPMDPNDNDIYYDPNENKTYVYEAQTNAWIEM